MLFIVFRLIPSLFIIFLACHSYAGDKRTCSTISRPLLVGPRALATPRVAILPDGEDIMVTLEGNVKVIIFNFSELDLTKELVEQMVSQVSPKRLNAVLELLNRMREPGFIDEQLVSMRNLEVGGKIRDQAEAIFMQEGISKKRKIAQYFKLYWKERIRLLPKGERSKVQNIFSDEKGKKIQRLKHQKMSAFHLEENKVILNDTYNSKLEYFIIKSHEAEHAISSAVYLDIHTLSKFLLANNLKEHKVKRMLTYYDEGRSIGAQWEFLQGIPEKQLKKYFKRMTEKKGKIEIIDKMKKWQRLGYYDVLLNIMKRAFDTEDLPDKYKKKLISTGTFYDPILVYEQLPNVYKQTGGISFSESRELRAKGLPVFIIDFFIIDAEKRLSKEELSLLKMINDMDDIFSSNEIEEKIIQLSDSGDYKNEVTDSFIKDLGKEIRRNAIENDIKNEETFSIATESIKNEGLSKEDFIYNLRVFHRYTAERLLTESSNLNP
jgi:hypothetical protein